MSTNTVQPTGGVNVPDHQLVEYKRIYVWELPVRLYHGINALAIVLLIITGYLIGDPHRIFYANEAYELYWFGWVRFIHFVSAFVYTFNFAYRIYWGFVGNKYADWRNFFPLTRKQRHEIMEVVKVDLLQVDKHGEVAVGHNPLAAFTYFFTFIAFMIQAITGFALYSSMSKSALPALFSWIVPIMGGEAQVRMWHHAFMWFFIVFIIVHVYLAFYHDYIEGRGTISAIVGGWKFEKVNKKK